MKEQTKNRRGLKGQNNRNGSVHGNPSSDSHKRYVFSDEELRELESIYEEEHDRIRDRRLYGGSCDAADILQETFLSILNNPNLKSIKYWRKRFSDRAHSQKRRLIRSRERDVEFDESIAEPDPVLAKTEVRDEVNRLFESLDPLEAELLKYSYLTGYSIAAIGRVTGRSPSAIKSRLHRARESARRVLRYFRQPPQNSRNGILAARGSDSGTNIQPPISLTQNTARL